MLRECGHCGTEKALDDFYDNPNGLYGKDHRCKTCHCIASSDRQRAHRDWLDGIKLASGCVDCGYREHAVALQFDHLPQYKKSFTVGRKAHKSRKNLELEIEKCEVVCANCHSIRTHRRRG